jgi:mRNA-degrading endonuclease RelE of RelBE toxin-antitoxin system
MMWNVRQTRRFARQYKKLHDNTAAAVDAAVAKLQLEPEAGDLKRGDLAQLRVLKFQASAQMYLLAYTLDQGVRLMYLEAVGPHENFYRDLKR